MSANRAAVLTLLPGELSDSRDLRMNLRVIGKSDAPVQPSAPISKSAAHRLDYDHQKSCKGKQNHTDPAWALWACMKVYREIGDNLFPYKCRFCRYWHVGHTNARILVFIHALAGYDGKPTATRLTYNLADAFRAAGLRG